MLSPEHPPSRRLPCTTQGQGLQPTAEARASVSPAFKGRSASLLESPQQARDFQIVTIPLFPASNSQSHLRAGGGSCRSAQDSRSHALPLAALHHLEFPSLSQELLVEQQPHQHAL